MSNSTLLGGYRAELFVRTDLPAPARKRRKAIEAKLQELARLGVLEQFETTVWKKRVPRDGDEGRPELMRFEEFTTWATEHGVELSPFFDTRVCYSTKTGDREEQLVVPVFCLAIYRDDTLERFAPNADRSDTTSVEDCIAEIADDEEDQSSLTPIVSTAD